jgi:hypothetical protein
MELSGMAKEHLMELAIAISKIAAQANAAPKVLRVGLGARNSI